MTPPGQLNFKPALVIFDWDDTLVDNYAAIHAAINAARARFGKPVWNLEETRVQCRRALNEIFPEWFGADWLTAKEVFYDVFAAEHIRCLQVKPGAVQLLDAFTRAGIPLALNSNKRNDFLRREVAHLGWDKYFTVLVGAGDVARGKPAPDGINHIRQVLAVTADAVVWFVGDNDLDAQTALSGGCLPILLQPRTTLPVGAEAGKIVLSNCESLLELFKTIA